MCNRCVADSVVNLNNTKAILNLAQAAHTLEAIKATSEKNTVLRRLDSIAELPRQTGEAEAATASAQGEDTGRTGEAPSLDPRRAAEKLIASIAKDLGISVEFIHLG